MFSIIENGLYKHLQDAWTINKARSKQYAQLTGGQSLLLSVVLITMEYLTAIPAFFIDWQAKKFHKQGVFIIQNDLVSMDKIQAPECKPFYQKRATPKQYQSVKRITEQFQKAIQIPLNKNQFMEVANITYNTLLKIQKLEIGYQCHFAMVKHLIESIGYGALHASDYARFTNGKTSSLSKAYLQLHVRSLNIALLFDHQVQKIHVLGVGFLVNDIPPIPFIDAWHSRI